MTLWKKLLGVKESPRSDIAEKGSSLASAASGAPPLDKSLQTNVEADREKRLSNVLERLKEQGINTRVVALTTEKDVEALCFAAWNALEFIMRHNLPGMYDDLGGVDTYCKKVFGAFMFAAEKILPSENVKAIAMSTAEVGRPPWSDDEMCSLFLPVLDQTMALIGCTHEVMPLVWLKVDLQEFHRS
jgi:hypothetical protein